MSYDDRPKMASASCYCGWSTTHFADWVCQHRLMTHTRRKHPKPPKPHYHQPSML